MKDPQTVVKHSALNVSVLVVQLDFCFNDSLVSVVILVCLQFKTCPLVSAAIGSIAISLDLDCVEAIDSCLNESLVPVLSPSTLML